MLSASSSSCCSKCLTIRLDPDAINQRSAVSSLYLTTKAHPGQVVRSDLLLLPSPDFLPHLVSSLLATVYYRPQLPSHLVELTINSPSTSTKTRASELCNGGDLICRTISRFIDKSPRRHGTVLFDGDSNDIVLARQAVNL